jgi:CRISPR-associated endonuclease/helicase Cas3
MRGISLTESIYRYWGKADADYPGEPKWHLLVYHSLDVAAVGYILLQQNSLLQRKFEELTGLDKETCSYWLLMFLGLHDIGKFSVSFQGLREDLLLRLQGKKPAKPYTVRHDSLGNLLWRDDSWQSSILPEMNEKIEYWQEILSIYSSAFSGHHGMPPGMKAMNDMRLRLADYFDNDDQKVANAFVYSLHSLLVGHCNADMKEASPADVYELAKRASWFLAGFVVLCDWVGSNSSWFKFQDREMPLDEYWAKHAIPQAIEAVRKAGIIPSKVDSGKSFNAVFPSIKSPTPLQRFVAECPVADFPQLFILEDITGSGKTEAALFLAHRLMATGAGSGIFMALPTMATSNAMFERMAKKSSPAEGSLYRRLFEDAADPSIVLSHSARHLSVTFMNAVEDTARSEYEKGEETASAQCSSWLADNRKKALLADVGVGTLDQALLAVLPSRFQSLRLFGLAGHILIVDEVHAYDPYMNKLLQNLLTFHAAMSGSAILLSATLPQHTRQAMLDSFARGLGIKAQSVNHNAAYPWVTSINSEQGVGEFPIEAMPQRRSCVAVKIEADQGEIERVIVEASRQRKCVCWIRNTVHDALVSYQALKPVLPPENLMLFHARFAMADRLDIEKTVTGIFGKESGEAKRSGKVLIATQVVEQSLDLDFDLLISDLVPMDLLIQRAGRLHRHLRDEQGNPLPDGAEIDRREPPCFIIHSPEPLEQADGDWFKKVFPKAAYVYPSHGCLWLTALLLKDKGVLRMPNDARELIEAAFGERADKLIPPLLRKRDLDANAKWQADKSLAHINMLKLEEGYSATTNQWLEDMRTPTRLGEMETTIRLARWDGRELTPWYAHSDFPWDMSQVSIQSKIVSREAESQEPALKEAMEKLKLTLPDKGKWSVLVPMTQSDNETWRGTAINKNGDTVTVTYSQTTGISVTSKEAEDDELQSD